MSGRTYRITELAALAGVTVRALRHYERLGLIRPSRTDAGYRVYSDAHLAVLEQVVALRFIGLPLKTIKVYCASADQNWRDALRAQRAILEDKKRLCDRAISASRKRKMHSDAARNVVPKMPSRSRRR